MDLAYRLILYILIANVGYMIFSLFGKGFRHYSGYIAQLLALLIFMIVAVMKDYAGLGVIAGSLTAIFILVGIPMLIQRRIEFLLAEQRLEEIEPMARLKSWVAWSDLNVHLHELSKAVQSGPQNAELALKSLLDQGSPFDEMTRTFLALVLFQSRNFEALIKSLLITGKHFGEYPIGELIYIIRALLETGKYEEAVSAQLAMEEKALKGDIDEFNNENILVSRLMFFSFMGWVNDFRQMMDAPSGISRIFPVPLRKYWEGIAFFSAGNYALGESLIKEALDSKSEEMSEQWSAWMRQRLSDLEEQREYFSQNVLPRLKELHARNHSSFISLTEAMKADPALTELSESFTKSLLGVIFGIHLLWLVLGDLYDLSDLLMFGANSSVLVSSGDYYRLVTYQFIHMGWLHLSMNMIALKVFGPPVETMVGRKAMSVIFLISGISGGLATVYMGSGLSVGASASVLGLLGAAIVLELSGRRETRAVFGKNSMTTMIFILLINIVIGMVEKGVDNSAHIGGLIGGAVITALIVLVSTKPKNSKFISALSMVVVCSIILATGLQFAYNFNRQYPFTFRAGEPIAASEDLALRLPYGWKIIAEDVVRAAYPVVSLTGPVGERIDIVAGPFDEPFEGFLDEYSEKRTRLILESPGLEFKSRTGPRKRQVKDLEYHEIIWDLRVEGQAMIRWDMFRFFEGNFILFQTVLPTSHGERYENLLHSILFSTKITEREK